MCFIDLNKTIRAAQEILCNLVNVIQKEVQIMQELEVQESYCIAIYFMSAKLPACKMSSNHATESVLHNISKV